MAIVGDHPISGRAEDTLGRAASVDVLVQAILNIDASQGFVVGIVGAWGSGKTSLVALLKEELLRNAQVPILEFNPWMFSGSQQLVGSFLREISAQLNVKYGHFSTIASLFESYGVYLAAAGPLPLIGEYTERTRRAATEIADASKKRQQSVEEQRRKISEALSELRSPFLVVIDDIDRLDGDEIREVFKLVRLTASFPNLIYILCFDQNRVAKALDGVGIDGSEYLSKIVQLMLPVPRVGPSSLLRELNSSLSSSVPISYYSDNFDHDRWAEVLYEIVLPLLRSIRDVKRYAAAVFSTVRLLGGKVALVDMLALEAIRLFRPSLLQAIDDGRAVLTRDGDANELNPSELGPSTRDYDECSRRLREASGGRQQLVEAVIRRLFPAADDRPGHGPCGATDVNRWLSQRRVAHRDVLAVYFEHTHNETTRALEQAESLMRAAALQGDVNIALNNVVPPQIESVISIIARYEGPISPNAVVPLAVSLYNAIEKIPESSSGDLFSIPTQIIVGRAVSKLLGALSTQESVSTSVVSIYAGLTSLNAKYQFVLLLRRARERGSIQILESITSPLERDFVNDLLAADYERLAAEKDLINLLHAPAQLGLGDVMHVRTYGTSVVRALLLNALTGSRSQRLENRAAGVQPRLEWESLLEILGSEDAVLSAVEPFRSSADFPDMEEIVLLVDRYSSGWRPLSSPFGDSDF